MARSVTTDLTADGSFDAVYALGLSMGSLSDSSRNNGALGKNGYFMQSSAILPDEQGIGQDDSSAQISVWIWTHTLDNCRYGSSTAQKTYPGIQIFISNALMLLDALYVRVNGTGPTPSVLFLCINIFFTLKPVCRQEA